MNYKFFYYPFTCATSTHIALLESGLVFDRELVDLKNAVHLDSDYPKINPKGAVPALLTPNGLLTENQAILTFIADQVPGKNLIPMVGTFERAKAHEWMNYCAASVHPVARSVFRPSAYAGDSEAAQQGVREQGLRSMKKCVQIMEQNLPKGKWAVGLNFSVVDTYLYLMYLMSRDKRIGAIPDSSKWRTLALRVHEQPSTQQAILIELGDRSDYELPTGFNDPRA